MNDVIKIYTDGSCSKNGDPNNSGGWGVVMIFGSYIKRFSGTTKSTTNLRMELQACIEGLKRIKTGKYQIQVFSDAKYLIDCFNDNWYKKWQSNNWRTQRKEAVKNKDLWIELIKLYELYRISFHYIKGHSGNKYNEEADQLAKQAMLENDLKVQKKWE